MQTFRKKVVVISSSSRGKHGVGRIDIVENRFIGMKSRGNNVFSLCHFALRGVFVSFSYLTWHPFKTWFFLTFRPVKHFEMKYLFHIRAHSLFFFPSSTVMNLDKLQSKVCLSISAIHSLLTSWAVNKKADVQCAQPDMTHTRAWTQTPFPSRHYVPWLANWLAGRLWLQRSLAGRNWKMGSLFFCPLSWTKDQSCFLLWRRWEGEESTRCPSGWITTIEGTCWSSPERQPCQHNRWWEGSTGNVTYLFVPGHIYLCWVREAEGGWLKWFVKNVVSAQHNIWHLVCQTNISQLSLHCQTSDLLMDSIETHFWGFLSNCCKTFETFGLK